VPAPSQPPSDIEIADRISRRRARVFTVMGVYFIAGQAIWFSNPDGTSRPAHVKIAAWLAWAVVLLIALAFAGGAFRGRRIRALVEDEVSRANRGRAYAIGFWVAAVTAIALYADSMFEDLTGREAVRIILTFSVGAAILAFGALERRALKSG